MEEIKSTVLKWNTICNNIADFNRKGRPLYTNVLEVIKNIKEFTNDIKLNRDRFNSILNQYLSENRAEIWIQFWIEHAKKDELHTTYRPSPLNPSFEYEWTTYLVNIDPKYDVSYENAQTMMNRMKSLRDISNCDDPAILAIHEGLECEGNGWFCWHCDSMESKWDNKLLNELKSSNNVFLNPTLEKEFINYAKDILVIPESWAPPTEYSCYNGPEYKDGWTTIQCIKAIVESDHYWSSLYNIRRNSDYSIFISMWSYINTVTAVLDIIVYKCNTFLE
jgi:hypothetical protein